MKELQGESTVFAPAKVNLHLKVLDKRPDGFHNLESVFLALNFGDTLHFEPLKALESAEIAMEGVNLPSIPIQDNIIYKALALFRQKTGFSLGFKITVEKRIPLGGGLGGGSSNAASTLLALNKLTGEPLNKETLLEMAAVLGSDVPFFIHQTTSALVSGRGEQIQAIEMPQMYLTLVNPGFRSDTAAAFRLLDENRRQHEAKIHSPLSFQAGSWRNFTNDFLSIFPEKEKNAYNGIILRLKELGAVYANLSGTGSTCFGVFEDKEKAQKAAEAMRDKWDFSVNCAANLFF